MKAEQSSMNATHTRIVNAFKDNHYLTSSQLVDIAGYRYSARLHELRGMGYQFPWGYKHDKHGKKTNTTLYTMRTV